MKYSAISLLFYILFATSAFCQNIVIISYNMDGLIEKGVRDEILGRYPDARFYTFACTKNIEILRSYYPFIQKINPDMIFVNGKEAVKDIYNSHLFHKEIVFHIKGDPVRENIVASNVLPVAHLTGVTTEISILEHIKVLLQMKKFKTLGVLKQSVDNEYLSSVTEIKRLSKFFNFNVKEVSVKDITKGKNILNDVDIIYIPYSQIPGIEIIDYINKKKIPTLSENDYFVLKHGALMALVVDEYRAGRFAGQKAVKVLSGAKASNIPITKIEHFMVVVNLDTAKKINYQIPTKFLIIADKIVR
ncbi:hypothetical protein LF845_03340 [Deferribacterales bacterium Es71-Z0220]|uniref:ABC transporter substrate binding protein n=1 Tax=Deferrivibrio essentukiensis TaxID=2880922 RepID=UPI001F60A3B8|nr:ABC transporter substrate binding protein [Deferrivibrio essentukiensis]MCB4203992.1 hypothetical protein [Deferrivibrio essentukiensis]